MAAQKGYPPDQETAVDGLGLLHARDGRAMEPFQVGTETVYNVYAGAGVCGMLAAWRVEMMPVETAVKLISQRAQEDADLADTLRYLAQDDLGPADPFEAPSGIVLAGARRVNQARQADRLQRRRVDALETAEVVRLVASLQDRRGVDRRRRRGQLLGWPSGSRTLHPAWQFDSASGETRPGLGAVIAALGQATSDPHTADELMRAPRSDLDGRSLADLFATGRVQTVLRLILASADQS